METGVLVAIVTSTLTLAGLIIKSIVDARATQRQVSVDYYHNLSGDAMARIAQLTTHIATIEKDNESLRCRVRELEAKVSAMAVQFNEERTAWMRETRILRGINQRYRDRLNDLRMAGVDGADIHDDDEAPMEGGE
jgi:peptidoglycan hydrolase CwlO-like protein